MENVDIDAELVSIGAYSFCNCTSLKNITIPGSIIIHAGGGNPIFEGCPNLENVYVRNTGNDNICYDRNGVLHQYSNLVCYPAGKKDEEYIVENDTRAISNYAFRDCKNLKVVKIPNSVDDIGKDAFKGCENLTDIFFQGYSTKHDDWNEEYLGCSATIHWDN